MHPYTSPSTTGGSKRKRVALACTACRSRKSRCNGARPKCSLCRSGGFECIYESTESSANIIVQKEYIIGLSERIQALEATIAEHNHSLRDHETRLRLLQDDPTQNEQNRPPLQTQAINHELIAHADLEQTPVSLAGTNIQELLPEERITDGMAISFVSEQDSGYFGPSSNISLLRHISRAISSLDKSGEAPLSDFVGSWDQPEPRVLSRAKQTIPTDVASQSDLRSGQEHSSPYFLPSEVVTRELICQYFSNTGLIYPYILEPSFIKEYDEFVASGFRKTRRSWLAVLYMVLAMSSSTLVVDTKEERQQRNLDSALFYERAVALYHHQSLRGTSLETVQYLLLVSHYLQGTQRSVQTWTTHGIAVKTAMSLGLHSVHQAKTLSRHEQELRKRAWFGCIVLDRMLSMTFGRPPIIPQQYIRLTLPEDILVSNDMPVLPHVSLSVQFFRSTITLMQMVQEVIGELYGHNLGCDPPLEESAILDRIFRLERSLDIWELDLPVGLTLLSSKDLEQLIPLDPVHLRFRTILTLRKLNLQILLHRPALTSAMDGLFVPGSETTIPKSLRRMRQNSIDLCVTAAQDIISIVHYVTTGDGPTRRLLGAWWFSLYYVFNSSLILFGHLLVLLQGQTDGSEAIQRCDRYFVLATEALNNLDAGNTVVKICNHRLSQLQAFLYSWMPANYSAQELLQEVVQQTSFRLGHARVDGQGETSSESRLYGLDESTLQEDGLDFDHFCLPGDSSIFFGSGL